MKWLYSCWVRLSLCCVSCDIDTNDPIVCNQILKSDITTTEERMGSIKWKLDSQLTYDSHIKTA